MFELSKFLDRESRLFHPALLGLTLLTGISGGLILLVTHSASGLLAGSEGSRLGWYALALAIFVFPLWFAVRRAVHAVEGSVARVRRRVLEKILRADTRHWQRRPPNQWQARLGREMNVLSSAAYSLVHSFSVAVTAGFCLLYLLLLSPLSGLWVGVATGLFALALAATRRMETRSQASIESTEHEFAESLHALIAGGKELRMNPVLHQTLLRQTEDCLTRGWERRLSVQYRLIWYLSKPRTYIAFLLLGQVFILPSLVPLEPTLILRNVTVTLFYSNSILLFTTTLPLLRQANQAVAELQALEAELDAASPPVWETLSPTVIPPLARFESIELRQVEFRYGPDAAYQFGPLDFTLHQGEAVFLTGGNGSGKTTLLHLITGLYRPTAGALRVDGEALEAMDYPAYRELFSAVFRDGHVFSHAHGLNEAQWERLRGWLARFELEGLVSVRGNELLIPRPLSAGQRKRQALAMALAEDKPILVLDEWTAEQSPEMRAAFYQHWMPEWREQGITILATTHHIGQVPAYGRAARLDRGRVDA